MEAVKNAPVGAKKSAPVGANMILHLPEGGAGLWERQMNRKNARAFTLLMGAVVKAGVEGEALLWLYLRQMNIEGSGSGHMGGDEARQRLIETGVVADREGAQKVLEKMGEHFFAWSGKGDRIFLFSPYRVLDSLRESTDG